MTLLCQVHRREYCTGWQKMWPWFWCHGTASSCNNDFNAWQVHGSAMVADHDQMLLVGYICYELHQPRETSWVNFLSTSGATSGGQYCDTLLSMPDMQEATTSGCQQERHEGTCFSICFKWTITCSLVTNITTPRHFVQNLDHQARRKQPLSINFTITSLCGFWCRLCIQRFSTVNPSPLQSSHQKHETTPTIMFSINTIAFPAPPSLPRCQHQS
jgi:hypothetical protein